MADSLEFKHKYTSGVIAWAPEDRPTRAQIGAVLDRFERTAWAGLEPDRYAWTAVEHRERGGGWGTMRWLSASIEDRLRTRAILDVHIEHARETLTHLEETTWRVKLLEIEGERFVVLPHGSLIRPPWTVGGRPAVKLSVR